MRRSYKKRPYFIAPIVLLGLFLGTAHGLDSTPQPGDIQARTIAICREFRDDDLGIKELLNRYDEQDDERLREISFLAIQVYVSTTLRTRASFVANHEKQLLELKDLEAQYESVRNKK